MEEKNRRDIKKAISDFIEEREQKELFELLDRIEKTNGQENPECLDEKEILHMADVHKLKLNRQKENELITHAQSCDECTTLINRLRKSKKSEKQNIKIFLEKAKKISTEDQINQAYLEDIKYSFQSIFSPRAVLIFAVAVVILAFVAFVLFTPRLGKKSVYAPFQLKEYSNQLYLSLDEENTDKAYNLFVDYNNSGKSIKDSLKSYDPSEADELNDNLTKMYFKLGKQLEKKEKLSESFDVYKKLHELLKKEDYQDQINKEMVEKKILVLEKNLDKKKNN